MSLYSISRINRTVMVTCDGRPIKLLPVEGDAVPFFQYGNQSEETLNLAHAILQHCVGSKVAELIAKDFGQAYLQDKFRKSWQISSLEIGRFAQITMKKIYHAVA